MKRKHEDGKKLFVIAAVAVGGVMVLVAAAIGILFVSGVVGQVDCGSDAQCIADKMDSCERARADVPLYRDNFIHVEVRGKQGGDCVVYQRFEGPDMQDLLADVNRQNGTAFDKLDLECRVPQGSDIAEISGAREYCTGTLLGVFE
jgi:hypothetical protein